MNTKTIIEEEYIPCGLTEGGTWEQFSMYKGFTKEEADKNLKEFIEHLADCAFSEEYLEYKIMKRTTITTVSEWEDV